MSLPTARPTATAAGGPSAVNDWNDTIRSLEHALIVGDAEQVASIAVSVTSGPIPPSMIARAEAVVEGIGRLEAEITRQMAGIAAEIGRHPARPRWSRPPAPGHLDCTA